MRLLAIVTGMCISAATVTQAVAHPSAICTLHPAPAPVIGAGIPVLLAVGGVLLATKLLARWRRS